MNGEEKFLPPHVALIMDGNRRWAETHGLSKKQGHEKGVDALRKIVRMASDKGIANLTVYGFSIDNWQRTPDEVDDLMAMVRNYLKNDLGELHTNKVRLKVIGKREGFDKDILHLIEDAESLTQDNQGLDFAIAFNYGARDEIARAAQAMGGAGAGATQEKLEEALGTPVDLLIRTGGEQRLSDFLLWQSAYAELMFIDAFWPDFTPELFLQSLENYKKRQRRLGV